MIIHTINRLGARLGLMVLLLAGSVLPAWSAARLTSSVMGSGGGRSNSTNFVLGGTGGQTALGKSTSPGFVLTAGFWPTTISHVTAVDLYPAGVSLLGHGAPNPFGSRMSIGFALAQTGTVRMRVIDSSGRLVKTLVEGRMEPGRHSVEWDGTDSHGRHLASGVFFLRFVGDGFDETQRITLLK